MPKLMEVIEYFDDKGDTMVVRIPSDGQAEIKWGAQLTVRESQSVVFFRDGKAIQG
jgi:membrane protease subunit (stomatin/prohibitin family)